MQPSSIRRDADHDAGSPGPLDARRGNGNDFGDEVADEEPQTDPAVAAAIQAADVIRQCIMSAADTPPLDFPPELSEHDAELAALPFGRLMRELPALSDPGAGTAHDAAFRVMLAGLNEKFSSLGQFWLLLSDLLRLNLGEEHARFIAGAATLRSELEGALLKLAKAAKSIDKFIEKVDRQQQAAWVQVLATCLKHGGPSPEQLRVLAEAFGAATEGLERAVDEHLVDVKTDGPVKGATRAAASLLDRHERTIERDQDGRTAEVFRRTASSLGTAKKER